MMLLGIGIVSPLSCTERDDRYDDPGSDLAGRIVSLLKSCTSLDRNIYLGPERPMGGLLDVYIDMKPVDEAQFMSLGEYVEARLKGAVPKKITPEGISRRLFTLAEEAERYYGGAVPSDDPVERQKGDSSLEARKAAALFARYHARKMLAGANLALFYRSGDCSSLRTSSLHAAAGLEIWERLAHLAGGADFSRGLLSKAGLGSWGDSLPFVRHDVVRLKEVRQILDRYGLFDLGLDFGPKAVYDPGLHGYTYTSSCLIERRFKPLDPATTYSRRRGYGWFDTAGISASPALPFPDLFLTENRPKEWNLPFGALYSDFARGTSKSVLLLDLPDGDYQVTAILANQPELASGSFQIRAASENDEPATPITYAAGESGDKSMNVRVVGGRLALEFVPEPDKDWLINGLILTRRIPHIGHVPIFAAAPGSEITVSATISAPDGVLFADLHLAAGRRMFTIPMLPDGILFNARVTWIPAWNDIEAAYYITARDRSGHNSRWPNSGSVRVRIGR